MNFNTGNFDISEQSEISPVEMEAEMASATFLGTMSSVLPGRFRLPRKLRPIMFSPRNYFDLPNSRGKVSLAF